MSCHICYSEVNPEKMRFLECMHSLCCDCLKNLQQKICPFCRAEIKIEIKQIENSFNLLRINFRNNNSEFRQEILEEDENIVIVLQPRRKKSGKNNYRKGRYATRSAHVQGKK